MGESGEGCLEGPCGEKMKKKGGHNVSACEQADDTVA